MTVHILLFGHYKDAVPNSGNSPFALGVPEGAPVATVAGLLAERDPRLSDLLTRTRVAVGAEFAGPDTPLSEGDELAFLPPMSGG